MATEQQLLEAESAYHKLLTGRSVASLQRDGRKVECTQADKYQLKQYIDLLKLELGSSSSRRGPARIC